jgi:hypothetical protein
LGSSPVVRKSTSLATRVVIPSPESGILVSSSPWALCPPRHVSRIGQPRPRPSDL